MKLSFQSISAFLVLAAVILACGSQSTPATNPAIAPTATIPPPTATRRATKPIISAETIQGNYAISGTNPDGTEYSGTLSLAVNDSFSMNGAKIDVYDAAWGDGSIGTGLLIADMLATTFGGGKCGAVFYAIDSDMGLAGLWLSVDTKQIGKETAVPTETRSSLAGEYEASGTNADGSGYEGTLTLIEQGDVWQLIWDIGGSITDGVGINDGDLLAAAYGGEGYGVGLYTAISDDAISGVWAQWGFQQIGTEIATRQ